jgi:hypothetical protein
VKDSHAYMLWSIAEIKADATITVRYTKDSSYFAGKDCACATCCPANPPVAPRRLVEAAVGGTDEGSTKRKKAHRAGRREQNKRQKRVEKVGNASSHQDIK